MRKLFLPTLLTVALLLISGGLAALAADPAPQSQSLRISPTKYELTLDKGAQTTRQETVTNLQIVPVNIKVSFRNILPNGEDGTVKATDETTPYDTKQWATFSEESFTLAPKESKTITVTLKAPANAESGGHYGWLQFSPVDPSGNQSLAISGSVATLYLITVPGPTKQGGDIAETYLTRQDSHRVRGLFIGTDLIAVARLKNEGNLHFPANPVYTIYNQFGKKVFSQQADTANVFPQAFRRFEAAWPNVSTGYYKVKVQNTFPVSGEKTKTMHVLVVTPRVLVGLGVLILLLLLTVYLRRSRTKPV